MVGEGKGAETAEVEDWLRANVVVWIGAMLLEVEEREEKLLEEWKVEELPEVVSMAISCMDFWGGRGFKECF